MDIGHAREKSGALGGPASVIMGSVGEGRRSTYTGALWVSGSATPRRGTSAHSTTSPLINPGGLFSRLLVVVMHGNTVASAIVPSTEALRTLGALDCARVNNKASRRSQRVVTAGNEGGPDVQSRTPMWLLM